MSEENQVKGKGRRTWLRWVAIAPFPGAWLGP